MRRRGRPPEEAIRLLMTGAAFATGACFTAFFATSQGDLSTTSMNECPRQPVVSFSAREVNLATKLSDPDLVKAASACRLEGEFGRAINLFQMVLDRDFQGSRHSQLDAMEGISYCNLQLRQFSWSLDYVTRYIRLADQIQVPVPQSVMVVKLTTLHKLMRFEEAVEIEELGVHCRCDEFSVTEVCGPSVLPGDLAECLRHPAPRFQDFKGPLEVRRSGVFCTEDVAAGTVMIVSNGIGYTETSNKKSWELIHRRAVQASLDSPRLSADMRTLYSKLCIGGGDRDSVMHMMEGPVPANSKPCKPYQIWKILRECQKRRLSHGALFILPSFLKHSCTPNLLVIQFGSLKVFKASTAIRRGEELSTCFVPGIQVIPREARQKLLSSSSCHCPQCDAEDDYNLYLDLKKHYMFELERYVVGNTNDDSIAGALIDLTRELEAWIRARMFVHAETPMRLRMSFFAGYVLYLLHARDGGRLPDMPSEEEVLQAFLSLMPFGLESMLLLSEVFTTPAANLALDQCFALRYGAVPADVKDEVLQMLRSEQSFKSKLARA